MERFDRVWARDGKWIVRIPQEDLCQALAIPPGLKYESEGGPGIAAITQFLVGSSDPMNDQLRFLRACIVFWLLAAPDGHAKNFSIFLLPGNRFKLAPIYDVISVFPLLARNAFRDKNVRVAMAALGKNRHYHWRDIVSRHWISTAKKCGIFSDATSQLLTELVVMVPKAIEQVQQALPHSFPRNVADPIFNGLHDQIDRLKVL